jgi:hypothetical protein
LNISFINEMINSVYIQFGALYMHCGQVVRVVGITKTEVFYVYLVFHSFSKADLRYFEQNTIKLKDQKFINKF